jgi:hypothetical protein
MKGIRSVTLNGKPVEGNMLPLLKEGEKHLFEVIMG